MRMNNDKNDQARIVEFSIDDDPFQQSRKKGPTSWILKHLFNGSNKFYIFIVFFTTTFSSILSSSVMIYIGIAINEFLNLKISSLIFYSIIILLLGLSAPLVRIGNFMLREVLAQRLERDTRKEFYVNILDKSQSFHDQQKIGDLMARTTDDVRMLNFLISPAVSLILESFISLIIPLIFIILLYPPQLLLAPIIFIILFIIALKDYVNKIAPVTGKMRYEFGQMNAVLNESLSGIELVKSTVQEVFETKKFFSRIKNYRDAYVKQGSIQAKYIPILLLAITNTVAFAHSIILYLQGNFDIGQIIAFLGLLSQLRFPTFISFFVFSIVKLASAGAKRLLEIMNNITEIDENIEGISKQLNGKISFKNVSFRYPGYENYILHDISFELFPGQTLAIVGTTGSGKTTLTKLISRLYDVHNGQILIDDIDIKNFSLKSLRRQISYIEQDVFLFSDTILNNISFASESSLDEIIEASKQAQSHEFIQSFPNGYDSEIGERGVQLSGGEKQRIAIARAFLTNPRILILDDSTSAIDSETEDQIQRAIHNILRKRTTILITHRLSQIRWADLILVLKRGRIEALGTHEQLLRKSEEYRKIFVKRFDLDEKKLLMEGET